MATPEMILVAAQAMWKRQNAPSRHKIDWNELSDKAKHGILEDARVALEAVEGF